MALLIIIPSISLGNITLLILTNLGSTMLEVLVSKVGALLLDNTERVPVSYKLWWPPRHKISPWSYSPFAHSGRAGLIVYTSLATLLPRFPTRVPSTSQTTCVLAS